jgi:2-C-methyl-D-erythritol 4-phosphate cytidylyltransferase
MPNKYWVLIPAGGVGQRFGSSVPKQYLSLRGKTVIEHTLHKFLYDSTIQKVVLIVGSDDYFWQQLGLEVYRDKLIIVKGGERRIDSVMAGLQAITHFAHPQDFILVHDAVRPCLSSADIEKLIVEVGSHPVGGILGSRVRDTLKHGNDNNEITRTFSRDNIWQALTPQMFRYKILCQALQQALADDNPVTDEASAIELLGFIPMIVEGRRDNIKITYPEDLVLAEKYLN